MAVGEADLGLTLRVELVAAHFGLEQIVFKSSDQIGAIEIACRLPRIELFIPTLSEELMRSEVDKSRVLNSYVPFDKVFGCFVLADTFGDDTFDFIFILLL
jgi:hypothetical protein